MLDEERDQQTAGEPDRESADVDQRRTESAPEGAQRNLEVVAEHEGRESRQGKRGALRRYGFNPQHMCRSSESVHAATGAISGARDRAVSHSRRAKERTLDLRSMRIIALFES